VQIMRLGADLTRRQVWQKIAESLPFTIWIVAVTAQICGAPAPLLLLLRWTLSSSKASPDGLPFPDGSALSWPQACLENEFLTDRFRP
jgi:hypothetical protein